MNRLMLIPLILLFLNSCQNGESPKPDATKEVLVKEGLKFTDIIGDTLRYDVGEPVFDIVISSDTTLYWKSFNPKYGIEDHEKIVVIPISDHENMVSYMENDGQGPDVCWYNDFARGITTVSVFVGEGMMTFSGTVKPKSKMKSQ